MTEIVQIDPDSDTDTGPTESEPVPITNSLNVGSQETNVQITVINSQEKSI